LRQQREWLRARERRADACADARFHTRQIWAKIIICRGSIVRLLIDVAGNLHDRWTFARAEIRAIAQRRIVGELHVPAHHLHH
jgi:hypothetical protein